MEVHHQAWSAPSVQRAPRRRSKRALTLSEREEMSRGIVAEQSIRSIAKFCWVVHLRQ